MGIDPKQLYYVDFATFKNSNAEIRILAPEIQKMRWDHFNKLREQNVFIVQEARRNLIRESYNQESTVFILIKLFFSPKFTNLIIPTI